MTYCKKPGSSKPSVVDGNTLTFRAIPSGSECPSLASELYAYTDYKFSYEAGTWNAGNGSGTDCMIPGGGNNETQLGGLYTYDTTADKITGSDANGWVTTPAITGAGTTGTHQWCFTRDGEGEGDSAAPMLPFTVTI